MNKAQSKLKEFERISLEMLAIAYHLYDDLQTIKERIKVSQYPDIYQEFAKPLYELTESSFADRLEIIYKYNPVNTQTFMDVTALDCFTLNLYGKIQHFHNVRLSIATDAKLTEHTKNSLNSVEGYSTLLTIQQDVNDLLKDAESVTPKIKTFQDLVIESLTRYESDRKGDKIRLKSKFFPSLNDRTNGGFREHNYIGILGSYKGGKTTFGINLIIDYLLQDIPCMIFSIEMPESQLMDKINANLTGTDFAVIERPERMSNFTERELSGLATKSYPLSIDCESYYEEDIISKIRLYHKKLGVKVFMIDYLAKIMTNYKTQTQEQQIGYISDRFMQIMKELPIVIIMLAQANRSAIKQVPTYAETAGSLALNRDCTYGFVIFNPYMLEFKEIKINNVEQVPDPGLFVLKQDISRFFMPNFDYIGINLSNDTRMRELYTESSYIQEDIF